jgi:hypothetical protein
MMWGVAGIMHAQAVLDPPFGLRWGDSPEKLITWASRHTLNLTIHLPGNQPGLKVLKIAPQSGFLPDTKASAVEWRFLGGRLYEATVHYADAEVTADAMETRFDELRRQLGKEHGTFHPNRQQRSVEDQFVTRTQSFHREPVKGLLLLLTYSEVEDLLRKSKASRFSLIYRNDNFRMQLEQELR